MAYGSLSFVIPCLQPFTGEGREAAAVFTKPIPHSSEGSVGTSGTLLAGELVQQQQQQRRPGAKKKFLRGQVFEG
jgi:hypothetical protein